MQDLNTDIWTRIWNVSNNITNKRIIMINKKFNSIFRNYVHNEITDISVVVDKYWHGNKHIFQRIKFAPPLECLNNYDFLAYENFIPPIQCVGMMSNYDLIAYENYVGASVFTRPLTYSGRMPYDDVYTPQLSYYDPIAFENFVFTI
jgi:hypothetical protein